MISKYFQSLNFNLSEGTTGLYALYYGNEAFYCCAYKNRNVYKRNIISLHNKITEQDTAMHDWEFHHVVEKQHLSDIPLASLGLASLSEYYQDEIPTVILHKREHRLLNSYLHFKEFRKLYEIQQKNARANTNAQTRHAEVNTRYASGLVDKEDITKMVDNLTNMYRNVYIDHPLFQILSSNFLLDLKAQIK